MLKFYIRTTGQRKLHESVNQIKYSLIIDNEKFTEHFPNHLRDIADTDIVLIEDDVVLCENFEMEIKRAISKFPNKIINFFNFPLRYKDSCLEKDFYFNQCVYIPKNLILPMANAMDSYDFKAWKINSVNKIMRWALAKLKLQHIVYKPCLVQHLDDNTLIWNDKLLRPNRRSPFFIDYLKELGIKWEDANSEENLHKLFNLMQKKFKEIDDRGTRYKPIWYKTCNFKFNLK